jgi:microcompartment protein CcmK/EutM
MRLGRIRGTIVSTVKYSGLASYKLLLVSDVDPAEPGGEAVDASKPYVAIDLIGAGDGEVVLVAHGSAARIQDGCQAVPTDAAVVGIVDSVQLGSKTTFNKH